MRARGWNDHAGEVVFRSVEVLERFAALLKNDMALIAEKERSLGFVNESLSDVLTDMTTNQFQRAKELINLFISSLTQIEYARKILYHRTHLLAQNSLQSTIDQAKAVKLLIKDRETAISRYLQAKNAHQHAARPTEASEMKVSKSSAAVRSLNQQTIQSTGTFANQLHRDLVTVLGSFAHAQMELYAKQVEVWAHAIEEIDQCCLDEDTDEITVSLQKIMNTISPVPDED